MLDDASLAPRPEFVRAELVTADLGDLSRPLTVRERVLQNSTARRAMVLLALALAWELYARYVGIDLLFPTFTGTIAALWTAIAHGPLLVRLGISLEVLLMGYVAGVVLAAAFTALAISTRIGGDILSAATAMLNPLPAIALLPLAMLWFGLGVKSIVFIITHSVLWPVAVNTYSGFQSVSETQKMAGQNVGLKGLRYVTQLLIPAAFPSILAGLRIGWAFGWRTLIAAEMVFGVASRSGGLGWFILQSKNELETATVFAGLLVILVMGLLIEGLVFRTIETRTIQRWGMQR
jgi:NitT/TauT family transport system permease protein